MRRLKETQKLALVLGVSGLLAAGGGGGVWWAKGLVDEKRQEIAQMRDEIQAANLQIAKIPAAEQDVVILRENLNEYVKILPEEKELNDFLRVANQFISQSGVLMTKFQPGRDSRRAGKSAFQRYTYNIDLEANLWQFMQFMSLFENYERFVQVKSFTLSPGGQRNAIVTAQDVTHKVKMTLESYHYTGSAKGRDVSIANYDHKVEQLREEIFEARQTISTPGYKFQGSRGRRDIFVDPRETSLGLLAGHTGPSPNEQKRIIERMSAELAEARKIYERLQEPSLTIFDRYQLEKLIREKLTELDREVSEIEAKGFISHAPLKLTWTRDVTEPLSELRRTMLTVRVDERDRWLSEDEMRSLLEKMKEDLLVGDIKSALDRYASMKDKVDVSHTDRRYPLRVGIESLHLRAKLADEFSDLRLDISGILVNEGGRSGVILNGMVYEEGEYVDNQLLVKQVGRDRIEFVYKGFTVVKTL